VAATVDADGAVATMAVSPKIYPPRPPREPVEEEAALVLEDGALAQVLVRNVSAAGFGAECRHFVRIGSHVSLDRGGRARRARVRWALRGRFGALFADETSSADQP
jgi:hypothetical protein